MIRFFVALFCLLGSISTAWGQTLFTYGKDSVSMAEFVSAYRKNNPGKEKDAAALREYLNLYIASRLKIKEAKENRYDTLPQLAADLDNLRTQIVPAYLNDAASVNKLITEAFARSQKDIHVGHIFIPFTNANGQRDTAAAQKRAEAIYDKLKKGGDFTALARQYSADTSAKNNEGDMGYITVFTLPYEIENIIYTTPVNGIAPIYKSKAGYHLFKNLGERKAIGKIKASQILFAFPPDADAATKAMIKKLADSVYIRLEKGDDFSTLAKLYSNDFISSATGGELPDFGVGQFSPSFENAVFSLKDGTISKPFLTPYGYHIVKRTASIPVSTKLDDNTQQTLKDKIEQDERINLTKSVLAQKIIKEAPYKKAPFSETELWLLSDSLLDYKGINTPLHIDSTTPLFTLGTKAATANEWIQYAQLNRYKRDGSGVKPYPQVWNEFVQSVALDYYKDHLETYNADFRQQLNEFKEGNLFFEIMQRKVWGPAQSDSAALQAYYQQHKGAYQWKESANVVIFYATTESIANQLYNGIKKTPADWKTLIAAISDKVTSDSGRFEISQLPNAGGAKIKEGMVTPPLQNRNDKTASFAYIIKYYPQPAPRSFTDAKSLVINDYQNELEQKWVKALKEKYPVQVNEKALEDLLSKK